MATAIVPAEAINLKPGMMDPQDIDQERSKAWRNITDPWHTMVKGKKPSVPFGTYWGFHNRSQLGHKLATALELAYRPDVTSPEERQARLREAVATMKAPEWAQGGSGNWNDYVDYTREHDPAPSSIFKAAQWMKRNPELAGAGADIGTLMLMSLLATRRPIVEMAPMAPAMVHGMLAPQILAMGPDDAVMLPFSLIPSMRLRPTSMGRRLAEFGAVDVALTAGQQAMAERERARVGAGEEDDEP